MECGEGQIRPEQRAELMEVLPSEEYLTGINSRSVKSESIGKSQIANPKLQMVRLAHHPERSRRTNSNVQNSKYQTCVEILKIVI
jgi:hypothetical protein